MTMAAEDDTFREPLWWAYAQRVEQRGPNMLTIAEVSSLTMLSATTIQVALNSGVNTGNRARLRDLARPQWNFRGIPLWSAEQVATYYEKIHAQWSVIEEFSGKVPIYGVDEVVPQQLRSLRGLSRVSGVPLGTLHRWKRSEEFPEPAALMRVASPTPRVLYSWPAVRECIQRHHADWLATHPEVDLDAAQVTDVDV